MILPRKQVWRLIYEIIFDKIYILPDFAHLILNWHNPWYVFMRLIDIRIWRLIRKFQSF